MALPMDKRIKHFPVFRKGAISELIPWSIVVAIVMMIYFAPHPEWHGDLDAFRNHSEALWHPYWTRWIFQALNVLPEQITFVLLSLTSIGVLYFAIKVFAGRHWIVFTSFAFAWTLYYGQIDCLVVGGIALAWLALKLQRPYLLGVGLVLASMKPQLSVPLILMIWWWSPNKIKSLVIPLIVFVLTLFQWGFWVPAWSNQLSSTDELINLSRSVSLWTITGPFTLLIWPLILWLPLPREKKLIAIAAGTAMSVPYFPLPSLILLLVMPVPAWWYVILQLPFLAPLIGYEIYHVLKIAPILLLIWVCWPIIKDFHWRPQWLLKE